MDNIDVLKLLEKLVIQSTFYGNNHSYIDAEELLKRIQKEIEINTNNHLPNQ